MYSVGLILLGITLLAQIPTLFVMPEAVHFALDHMNDIYAGASMFEFISEFQPTQHLWAYAAMEYMRYFLLAVGVVFSLFANRFYLRHAVKKVTRVREGMLAAPGHARRPPLHRDDRPRGAHQPRHRRHRRRGLRGGLFRRLYPDGDGDHGLLNRSTRGGSRQSRSPFLPFLRFSRRGVMMDPSGALRERKEPCHGR